VAKALKTVAKWVAKLPLAPLALLALLAAPLVPKPLASPSLEVDVIPRRQGLRQSTKRLHGTSGCRGSSAGPDSRRN
jgi:hypothetical protein